MTPSSPVLFPDSQPLRQGHLEVSGGHRIFFAEYGNACGVPALVVHGGPGTGCGPLDHRFFDPERYRVVTIDQRGSGRSTPHASMAHNTTQDLINDMETVRHHLGIERWLLFGGSWGSALAMAYGQQHAHAVTGFILRGVCLARREEFRHLIFGMSRVFQDHYEHMLETLGLTDRDDVIGAIYQRLMSDDPNVNETAARAFCEYDLKCGTLLPENALVDKIADRTFVLGLARTFFHYGMNDFFLADTPIFERLSAITHLPCHIVQGRYDLICPMDMAWHVHRAWPGSTIELAPNAGHSSFDPPLTTALLKATARFLTSLPNHIF